VSVGKGRPLFHKKGDGMNFKIDSFKAKIPVNSVFRCLRISAGMTTKELGRLMECSSTLITHYEMGNRVLPEERVGQLCKVFRISREDLEDYVTGKRSVPVNYQDECVLLLSKMDTLKLQAVYGILVSMAR
jgi:transcriptional regulator with XRE-family HTH domain